MLKQCFEPNCFRVRLCSVDVDVDFLASPGKQTSNWVVAASPPVEKREPAGLPGLSKAFFASGWGNNGKDTMGYWPMHEGHNEQYANTTRTCMYCRSYR